MCIYVLIFYVKYGYGMDTFAGYIYVGICIRVNKRAHKHEKYVFQARLFSIAVCYDHYINLKTFPLNPYTCTVP